MTGVRVLYFLERFWPLLGGVEVLSARIAPRLVQRGHEVVIVTGLVAGCPAHDSFAGVPVHRLPLVEAIRDRDLSALAQARRQMAAIVGEFRPQLLHAAFTGPGLWALPKPEVAPLLLSLHTGDGPAFAARDGLMPRTFERAAWTTACSRALLDVAVAAAPQLAARCSVVHPSIDPAPAGLPDAAPPGPPVLLSGGRMVAEKGLDVAVRALALLPAGAEGPRLLLAGEGPERGRLEALADSLGVADRTRFEGWVAPERMRELVAAATVVVVPSRAEPFGLVALEGSAGARPVVASAVGGLGEVVQDGVTGTLVAPDDPPALAAAIGELLAAPERARAMGRAGRERAYDVFAEDRELAEWDALYERLATP